MSKAYHQYRADLADAAAVETYVLANPTQFTPGTMITAADGVLIHVKDAAGDTGLVTETEPTP